MTASTPDEIIAGFPHSSLPKVTGEPTFEDLNVIRRLLNTNDMSVALYEVGGRHRHLGIIMTNEEYFAIAVDVFPVPVNPGPSAPVVAGMTAAVIAETTRLHGEATQVYRTYNNVDQAIKNLLIEAFNDEYRNALSDEIFGYANCTSLQILTHLLTYYAMIAPSELTQNYERLNTPYDPNQPIEAFSANSRCKSFRSSRRTAIRCGNDCQCGIHSCIQHRIFSRRLPCMAIESDRGQDMGPVQDRFYYCSLRISSHQSDCTAVWLPQREHDD
jgi:hypothetical protein